MEESFEYNGFCTTAEEEERRLVRWLFFLRGQCQLLWKWLLGCAAGSIRLLSMTGVGNVLRWQLGEGFLLGMLLVC